jgi:Domain of unknown function (DUF1841)
VFTKCPGKCPIPPATPTTKGRSVAPRTIESAADTARDRRPTKQYFGSVSEADGKAFACPPAVGEFDGIDLTLLDPADEDDRRMLIEAEHPDLKQALDGDVREIRRGADVMNPRLHITMHEIVANQLWADEPPEVWQTAKRLSDAGYERHEVLHMLGSVVSGQVWASLRNDASHDLERVRLELAALPEGWESMRDTWPIERSRNRAERRAEERRRRPGH